MLFWCPLDFSLTQWYQDLSLPQGSVLSLLNRDKLLDQLGIRSYLNKVPCSFNSTLFSPANSQGWKNGESSVHLKYWKLMRRTFQVTYIWSILTFFFLFEKLFNVFSNICPFFFILYEGIGVLTVNDLKLSIFFQEHCIWHISYGLNIYKTLRLLVFAKQGHR